jgi:transposase InsO family protein
VALGRPVRRGSRTEREAVVQLLDEVGAGVGLPTLRDCFPALARAELEDLLRRYRRVCRVRYSATLNVLHWTVPGRVWAIDFAEAPLPVEGSYPYVLAVRDLASGEQLLWSPAAAPTAEEAGWALAALFAHYGPPLVLKSDNGSAFLAAAMRQFLAEEGVIPLFSPPRWPQYNGAIEAGIGALKTRTERQAARAGHSGEWTIDAMAAAQAEANAARRPHRDRAPQEVWSARPQLTAAERAQFQEAVARQRAAASTQDKETTEGSPNPAMAAGEERAAIRRALVEHGYLLFSRRRIPLPIRRRKTASIT